ncbi:hypothetical protein, partial [Vibrio anguillarum]|nr:hypothetical protein [Vibrio anguillarum]
LSYIKSIEDNFYRSLRDKYGDAVFTKLAKESFKISKLKYYGKEESEEEKTQSKDDNDIVF